MELSALSRRIAVTAASLPQLACAATQDVVAIDVALDPDAS